MLNLKNAISSCVLMLISVSLCPGQDTIQPSPVEGWDKLQETIQRKLSPRSKNVSGIIYVETVIDKKGEMTDTSIVKGIEGYADEDVNRVVQNLNYPFNNGIVNGQAVASRLIFAVYYGMTEEEVALAKSKTSN